MDVDELGKDVEELQRFMSGSSRPNVKKYLSDEVQRITKIIDDRKRQDAAAAVATAAASSASIPTSTKITTGQDDGKVQKAALTYPTSSKKGPKDWDAIERELTKEEEEEGLEGDAAVNQMFQKIYKDAPDDVKKAMIKSYTESGGTCLSTDWADVSKKQLKVKPPDGMEFKKW